MNAPLRLAAAARASEHTRRVVLAAGAALLLAFGSATLAVAGHEPGAVPSYTGCLNPNGGTLYNVQQGETPLKPCNSGQPEIHVSGGDITGVTAGAGLTGGGTEGNVSLGVDQTSIVTAVTPGFGLLGGGSGGDLVLAVDPTQVQKRVTADCAQGGAITAIAESGTVSCSAPGGVVATVDASRVTAEGSHDTSFCDGFTGEGSVEFEASSGPVTLPAGTYLPVPAGADGFDWHIRKAPGTGGDPDDHYRGRAWAFIKQSAGVDPVVSDFIRDFSSAGQNNNNQRDFGVFTTAGGDFYLEIFAGAEACSYVSVGGPVALVRIG
jgi:hypothetical protein